jgi:hypothetical protein
MDILFPPLPIPPPIAKDFIDREIQKADQRYFIADRFFKVWIQKRELPLGLS